MNLLIMTKIAFFGGKYVFVDLKEKCIFTVLTERYVLSGLVETIFLWF